MRTLIKTFIILLTILVSKELLAQKAVCDSGKCNIKRKSIYHINNIGVGCIILGGLATDYPAIGRLKSKPGISDSEIAALNPGALNSFDRLGLKQNPAHQAMFATISDYSQVPIFMLPAFLALDKNISKDWWGLLLMYAEGHVLTFTLYNYSFFGPTFQSKYRPLTYYTQLPLAERESGNNRNSFYSGHVASTAYASFFIAKVYCDYHPNDGGSKYWIYAAALVPPLFMSYCRVMALDHFPSDCMVGFMIGATMGIIVPELHKNHFKDVAFGLYTPPGATGLTCLLTIPETIK